MTIAPESFDGELMMSEETAELSPHEVVRNALTAYFGGEVGESFNAHLRKDYTGPASAKRQIGGAMIVTCNVLREAGFEPQRLVIDDENRPFDEDVLAILGATANANWDDPTQPHLIRDYPSV